MRDNQSPLFSTFDALVFGALIGAAAGLLLAPHEGKKTRKIVHKKVNEWAEQGQAAFEDFKAQNIDPRVEDLKSKAEDLGNQFQDLKDDVQNKVDDTKEKVEDLVSDVQDEVSDTLDKAPKSRKRK